MVLKHPSVLLGCIISNTPVGFSGEGVIYLISFFNILHLFLFLFPYFLLHGQMHPQLSCLKIIGIRAEYLKPFDFMKIISIKNSVIFWPFDPAKNAIRRWCTSDAVRRGNRVGGNWLTKWDEVKNSQCTLID